MHFSNFHTEIWQTLFQYKIWKWFCKKIRSLLVDVYVLHRNASLLDKLLYVVGIFTYVLNSLGAFWFPDDINCSYAVCM